MYKVDLWCFLIFFIEDKNTIDWKLIWLLVLRFFIFQDVCMSCGLIACTSITFVIMFMPKGRQLSAMGKEGLYAEDRTEVYTGGSGTGSTGSSGTPSPSFFPVKPAKLAGNSHSHAASALEALKERERLDTPDSHRHLQSKFIHFFHCLLFY